MLNLPTSKNHSIGIPLIEGLTVLISMVLPTGLQVRITGTRYRYIIVCTYGGSAHKSTAVLLVVPGYRVQCFEGFFFSLLDFSVRSAFQH